MGEDGSQRGTNRIVFVNNEQFPACFEHWLSFQECRNVDLWTKHLLIPINMLCCFAHRLKPPDLLDEETITRCN